MTRKIRDEWKFNYGERIKRGQNIPSLISAIKRMRNICTNDVLRSRDKFNDISHETINFIMFLRQEGIDELNEDFKEKSDYLFHLLFRGNIYNKDDGEYWAKEVIKLLDQLETVIKTISQSD